MAITRCPYCHAIIDENAKYCNNCGTQLLFTEDEKVEEEIPGEKIIDAETEEKDYTVEEPEDEKRPAADRSLDKDIDEELEKELKEETEELALDELVAKEAGEEAGDDVIEEVILVDEIEASESAGKGEPEESDKKEETSELKDTDDEEEDADEDEEREEEEDKEKEDTDELKPLEEEGEEKEEHEDIKEEAPSEEETAELAAPVVPADETEPVIEYLSGDRDRDETVAAGEAVPQPATFDTRELEGIGKTVELSKDKIDKFLEVLTEKRVGGEAPPKDVREPTGTLPPWASTMKGAPVFPDETGPVDAGGKGGSDTAAAEEEVEIFPRRRDSDSTIGLPERVSQAPLPFDQGAAEEEEEEEPAEDETRERIFPPVEPSRPEREAVRLAREQERREAEVEVEEEGEEAAPRPPFSFSVFFKSKAFDVLFVGLFWLVALWLAAYSMGMTLFGILGSMSGSMLLLYAVFILIYFFLFKFFLGETLGDRLFRERE